jgi:predicted kinase
MKAILTVSIQGAGKTTYAKHLASKDPTIKKATKDDVRFMLFDTNRYSEKFEENILRFGFRLDRMYEEVIRTILSQDLNIIIDETNHTKPERERIVKFLRGLNLDVEIEAHYLHRPFEDCWERNIKRRPEQIVPRLVMERYYQELIASFGGSADPQAATEALSNEGFKVVECIDMGKMFI